MKKSRKTDDHEDEAVVIERMNEALKRMMNTPPETHKEMVERRRGSERATAPRRKVPRSRSDQR